jgi:hypothetical protein
VIGDITLYVRNKLRLCLCNDKKVSPSGGRREYFFGISCFNKEVTSASFGLVYVCFGSFVKWSSRGGSGTRPPKIGKKKIGVKSMENMEER